MTHTLEQTLLADVEGILGPQGLAMTVSGFHYNPDQHAYAQQAAKGFARVGTAGLQTILNSLQASTGTGKTLGYLVPLMCYAARQGERVMVSTYTRFLQKQIADKDAELARQWVFAVTGQSLTVAKRVGMQNYASLDACSELYMAFLLENPNDAGDHIDFLVALCAWLDSNQTLITIDDYLDAIGRDALPDKVDRARIGITGRSPKGEILRYQETLIATKEADVLITNHALSALNARSFKAFLDDAEKPVRIAVFDEADRLESVCRSLVNSEVSVHQLLKICQKVKEEGVDEKLALRPVKELFELLVDHSRHGKAFLVPEPHSIVGAAIDTVLTALEPSAKRVRKTLNAANDVVADERRVAFLDAYDDLKTLRKSMAGQDDLVVISWSPVKHYPSLRVGRAQPAQILSRLWNVRTDPLDVSDPKQLAGILFTSATLSSHKRTLPEAFDEFHQKLGIIRHPFKGQTQAIHAVQEDLFGMFQPKVFGQLAFVLADPTAPAPIKRIETDDESTVETNPEWLTYCTRLIQTAASYGRTLVLAASYADTEKLAVLLNGQSGLIVHERGRPLGSYLRVFKDNPSAVFITPAGWEGLDLPGVISQLVVARLPFSPPNTIDAQLMKLQLARKGTMSERAIDDLIRLQSTNEAVRRLSQGFGRAIRSRSDSARVWIADPRFPLPLDLKKRLELYHGKKSGPTRGEMKRAIAERFENAYRQAAVFSTHGQLI